ncbi:MAG TPA: peptidoglycan-binding domain-containing protein [Gaiellaceae bacterium]
MIAGLDSSASKPSAAQLAQAKAHGVKMWCGYLATKPHVNIGFPWARDDFARVKAAGLTTVAFCSGKDDPVACKNQAAAWGVRLCLDVEDGIRLDGPWVQDWLTQSGAGLYGHQSVFPGRRAPFYILTRFPGHDPGTTWDPSHARPNGPCGWQWGENRSEFGCNVDRGWYDDWFAGGAAVAPPFPYPTGDYLALPSPDPHCHSGKDAAEQANVRTWQAKMAQRGWQIAATGIFDATSDDVCRKFQQEKGLVVDGKVGGGTWRTTWTAPVT